MIGIAKIIKDAPETVVRISYFQLSSMQQHPEEWIQYLSL